MSGYRVGDAHPAKNTTPHGSHADPSRTCDECGASFKPRILIGANASRFCGTPCKDRWHARTRKKQSPPSVAADTAGANKNNMSGDKNTAGNIRRQLNPDTKKRHVLAALLNQSLNRFDAERIAHDHCLHSTISGLERHGLRIDRKDEIVPGYLGRPTRVMRYWIPPDQHEAAARLLGLEQ